MEKKKNKKEKLINDLVRVGEKSYWRTWGAVQRYVEKHPRKYVSISFEEISVVCDQLEIITD